MVGVRHVDNDFLVHAVSHAGPERRRLIALADAGAELRISAVAWYEWSRGPRTPEQMAVARAYFGDEGIVPFDEGLAARAGEVFRLLGSPRRRAADVCIGVTAAAAEAILLTCNRSDFAGIPGLRVELAGR
jgi:predicted nucleic acid-binding protein